MKASFFRDELLACKENNSHLQKKNLHSIEIQIYPRSIQKFEQVIFFIAKDNIEKYLFLDILNFLLFFAFAYYFILNFLIIKLFLN